MFSSAVNHDLLKTTLHKRHSKVGYYMWVLSF